MSIAFWGGGLEDDILSCCERDLKALLAYGYDGRPENGDFYCSGVQPAFSIERGGMGSHVAGARK